MTTTPPQGETPSVNDYLQTPEYDNGNKSPEQSGNDDMANPTESNMWIYSKSNSVNLDIRSN